MSRIARRAVALLTLCVGLGFAVFAVLGSAGLLRHLGFSSQSWVSSAALVALVGTAIAVIYYYRTLKLSERIADRAVTVEAQKLLLEFNKALVADPRLFSIYKEGDELHTLIAKYKTGEKSAVGADTSDLPGKLVALGSMLINVFEIVFAQMPEGPEHLTWKAYFEDSLNRCPFICDLLELKEADKIYHPNLMAAFRLWRKTNPRAPNTSAAERMKNPA